MKKLCIFGLCLLSLTGEALAKNCFGPLEEYDPHSTARRFAVVSSADGYSNLRKAEGTNSPVVEKLPNGTLLNIWNEEETAKNWCFDDQLNGYIHVSQLKDVEEFQNIPAAREAKQLLELKNADVQITVKSKPFDVTQHKIVRGKEEEQYIIDGVVTYSYSPAHLPKYEYESVKIQFKNNDAFYLPKEALTGLFELSGNVPSISAYYNPQNDQLFLRGVISDASVVADFIWLIENKQYKKRYIYTN